MTERTQADIVASMTNIADSGQDQFVQDQMAFVKHTLYEMGVSKKFLEGKDAAYIIGKAVTDIVEDGQFSNTAISLIASLRSNHPHSEDSEGEVANV